MDVLTFERCEAGQRQIPSRKADLLNPERAEKKNEIEG
jgi:hypothetical protein